LESSCTGSCNRILISNKTRVSPYPRKLSKPTHEFFLTAQYVPQANDVTVVTMLTIDRLLRLKQLADTYQGAISAAIFIKNEDELFQLWFYWLSHPILINYVDVHIVVEDDIIPFHVGDRPFPINFLRNIAIQYARTKHVFYIEADFLPGTDLHKQLGPVIDRLLLDPKSVYVIASFLTNELQFTNHAGFDLNTWPKNKEELQPLISYDVNKGIVPFHIYAASHSQFPFDKWLHTTDFFSVPNTWGFEPYYIAHRNYPEFEQLMLGCGKDKVVQFDELAHAGYRTFGYHEGFIVHLDSTGLGTPWCRDLLAAFPKYKGYMHRVSRRYMPYDKKKRSKNRIVWWDEGEYGNIFNNTEHPLTLAPPNLTSIAPTEQSRMTGLNEQLFTLVQEKERLRMKLDDQLDHLKLLLLQTCTVLATFLVLTLICVRKFGFPLWLK